jgi:hypothetical protein
MATCNVCGRDMIFANSCVARFGAVKYGDEMGAGTSCRKIGAGTAA